MTNKTIERDRNAHHRAQASEATNRGQSVADTQYDIFIAYKSEDRETAVKLLGIFEAQGWRVFIDTRINAGARYEMVLEQALEASHAVVVLWSNAAKSSRFVMDEAKHAAEREVLFPALVEDTRPPYGYGGFQTVNLCNWQGDETHMECQKLISALSDKLGGRKPQPRNDPPPNLDIPTPSAPEENRARRQPGDTYHDTLKDGSQGPAMVVIPAGRFLMGSPDGEGHSRERPQHEVVIAEPFSMGQYAVSFAEFDYFCAATDREPPTDDFGRNNQPAINVSWHDAAAYCQWLSDMSGKDYRLPSEAGWEYACRAGTTTPWNTGKKLSHEQANFDGKNNGTVPVNQYKPNNFGLYQMHGNVWEWCQDKWHSDYNGAPTDGSARDSNSKSASRALRGGSWLFNGDYCRSSYRYDYGPDARYLDIGFRLSCLSPIT